MFPLKRVPMGRSFMAYIRHLGAVSGSRNVPKESLVRQVVIDTLPMRIMRKSFASVIGADSNRHSSDGTSARFSIGAVRPPRSEDAFKNLPDRAALLWRVLAFTAAVLGFAF